MDVFTLESYDLYRCLGTRGFCRVRGAYLKLDTGRVVYSLLWCWRRGPRNVKLAAAARDPPSISGHAVPRHLCLKAGAGVLAGRRVQARLDRDIDLGRPAEGLRWQRPLLEAGVALDREGRLGVLWLEVVLTWRG